VHNLFPADSKLGTGRNVNLFKDGKKNTVAKKCIREAKVGRRVEEGVVMNMVEYYGRYIDFFVIQGFGSASVHP